MTRNKKKIIRMVTVPQSIWFFREVMCRMEKMGYESVVVTSPGKQLDDFRKEYLQFRTIEVPMEGISQLGRQDYETLQGEWCGIADVHFT